MKWVVLSALLAGCSPAAAPPAQDTVEVPQELTHCPAGSPQPATPKPPRTTEIIADAFNKAKLAGQKTEAALRECSDRLDRLNQMFNP